MSVREQVLKRMARRDKAISSLKRSFKRPTVEEFVTAGYKAEDYESYFDRLEKQLEGKEPELESEPESDYGPPLPRARNPKPESEEEAEV